MCNRYWTQLIETAARLCAADDAAITIREGEVYRFVASSYSAADPEHWAAVRQRTIVPGRQTHRRAGGARRQGRANRGHRADPDFARPETVTSGDYVAAWSAAVARRRGDRRDESERRRSAVHRQPGRIAANLCRAGSHRDRPARLSRIAAAHPRSRRNRSNTRPRPATCSRSSAARPSICSRCSTPSSKRPPGSATPATARSTAAMARCTA